MARSKTPDYNPDKESHTEHKFIVQPAWPSVARQDGVTLPSGRKAAWGKSKRFFLKDEKEARELQQEHRNDLVVTRVRYPHRSDRGHVYFFGQMPAMPWHRYDENGRRIREDKV